MSETHETPCAAKGLLSYRYKANMGWVMIGATDDADALSDAQRSFPYKAEMKNLERWDGQKYVGVE